ncbi:MAG: 3'(2'),5'-bisphosphate nucleotidase CysQ [Terriglobia bacterium]
MPDAILETLERIENALQLAACTVSPFVPGAVKAEQKSQGRGPVTEADHASNHVLRETLVRDGEGWLSEESVDSLDRLGRERVWIVDPLDGTLEFVSGIPEWCISVAMVEDGRAIAGGILNPATGEVFLGAKGKGLTYNGQPAGAKSRTDLHGAVVLASRSEIKRGEWEVFKDGPVTVQPCGSVAYKLARVAAGLADATWTLTPKHEWDVAAGIALVEAAGGFAAGLNGEPVTLNSQSALLHGLIAAGSSLKQPIMGLLEPHLRG